MVVSRLGPPGLGAGAVWAAYTTVYTPVSSSLYFSKASHFFYWSFPSSSIQAPVVSPSVPPVPAPPQAIQRLNDQNHLLTQEVTEKSERITQLEQEKATLIKQLFEARA